MHPLRVFVVALSLAAGLGCKPKDLRAPNQASLKPTSELMPEADRLINGLLLGRVSELHAWMSPSLKTVVRPPELAATGERLRTRYGQPIGILEEKVHKEGDLTWYSGLVVYARGKAGAPDRKVRLVLFQFAITPDRALDRLLVREHLAFEQIAGPARRYSTVTRLHFVSTGEWTIVHGGPRRMTNYHHNHRAQRFAYDMVVMKSGRSKPVGGSGNKASYCYGYPVLAPASGTVIRAVNNVAENGPGATGEGGGNGVIIDHGFGEASSLWHMIPGTVTVKVGDKVELGQELGKVGNSGHSSGPHIHFHVSTKPGSPQGELGLPAPFVDVYIDGAWYEREMPVRSDRVRRTATDRLERKQRGSAEVLIDAAL
ncbi:M23 family metallopeptidase [Nannocystis sp. ILAH1]|uniref:M23 family metallopeptidase n=1 Tax=unclassified Nannocystis TaxID=2627009 RepID=UPI00227128A5|nr:MULTISPECIES: M23 family metallopeptidase [unclassified Nannocystis]MCY0986144.1 M23 family metallopeptidase [Nannocystis sp. ILAH1]MCY1068740.1 M23 family metallopeptidase [Nannocystis sp. RBIL2]